MIQQKQMKNSFIRVKAIIPFFKLRLESFKKERFLYRVL